MDKTDKISAEILGRILSKIDKSGIDQKTFAQKIGISPTTITDWKTGKSHSYNRPKMLALIANGLETTTEYLLTGKETVTPAQHQETTAAEDDSLLEEFGRIFDTLTPENQNAVIAEMLRRLRNQ